MVIGEMSVMTDQFLLIRTTAAAEPCNTQQFHSADTDIASYTYPAPPPVSEWATYSSCQSLDELHYPTSLYNQATSNNNNLAISSQN